MRCWILVFASLAAASASEETPLTELSLPFLTLVDGVLRSLRTGGEVSANCRRDADLLLRASASGEDWAVRMVDSMGRPNNGMAEGGLNLIGSFSECVDSLAVNNASGVLFKGQYCLVQFKTTNAVQPKSVSRNVWKLMLNQTLELALCVPWTCSAEDLTYVLDEGILQAFPNSSVYGNVTTCHLRDTNFVPTPAAITVIIVLCLVLVLSISGTFYDVMHTCKGRGLLCSGQTNLDISTSSFNITAPSTEQLCQVHNRKDKLWKKMLVAFSVRENGKKILVVGDSQGGSIQIFHGMRFLSMVWIICGHSFSFALTWMTFRNPQAMANTPADFSSQIFANGTFSVDTFFYLSGFLVTYCSMKVLKKTGGKINVPLFIFHRYIRMTPLMMIIIGFCATLLKYTGSGPTWLGTIAMYDAWCAKNWWINALYLQNFIDTPNMCLSHSWYSAVDMQFFIISPLYLYLLYKNRKVGLSAMLATFLLSVGVTMYISIANHLPPIPFVGNVVSQDLLNEYSSMLYIKPYCRLGPYLVGLSMGYFVDVTQGSFLIRKKYIVLGWILAITANLSVLYSMWPAYDGYPVSDAGSAVYSGIARTVWALGLSWLTYACISGYGGFVNTLLSWRAFVPLSRLTYCVYLIHPVVMAVFYGSREISFDFSVYLMVYFLIGNLVISYIVSFILSLLFESPFIALEKAFVGKV